MARPHLEYASVIWNPHHKQLKVLLKMFRLNMTGQTVSRGYKFKLLKKEYENK